MRLIRAINAPNISEESLRRISYDYAAIKWIVQKIDPTKFGTIEKAINSSNINALEQNNALGKIIAQQH